MHHPTNTVLIAGGSGLIGQKLISYLQKGGCNIVILTRKNRKSSDHIQYVLWDPSKNFIDPGCPVPNVIINLAGENVGEGRWTESKKSAIVQSRIDAANTLKNWVETNKIVPDLYTGASAVGYYGDRGGELLSEQSTPGSDFLASVCQQWEEAQNELKPLVKRLAILRFGVVFSAEGGAFPKLLIGKSLGLLSVVGSGKQYQPWIHIEDVCMIISTLIEDTNYSGVINVVSQEEAQAQTLTKEISAYIKGIWGVLPVPGWVLKMVLGEKATLVLNSQRVFPDKLVSNGFVYQYPDVSSAVRDLVKNES